ncbi:MAG: hypothetical protein Q7R81_00710 [Candidatus Peregrinibacteria bacterium]|nr:hypothetical protein [Candidatus Peregrinibacteria bacterium]
MANQQRYALLTGIIIGTVATMLGSLASQYAALVMFVPIAPTPPPTISPAPGSTTKPTPLPGTTGVTSTPGSTSTTPATLPPVFIDPQFSMPAAVQPTGGVSPSFQQYGMPSDLAVPMNTTVPVTVPMGSAQVPATAPALGSSPVVTPGSQGQGTVQVYPSAPSAQPLPIAGNNGTTVMNATAPTGNCSDIVDNDQDSWIDFADPDCQGNSSWELLKQEPVEVTCNDGQDNDGDQWTDFADPDCQTRPSAPQQQQNSQTVQTPVDVTSPAANAPMNFGNFLFQMLTKLLAF